MQPKASGKGHHPTQTSSLKSTNGRVHRLIMRWDDDISPYLFLLPAFILFCLFVLYPLFYNFQIGFFKWDGINPQMQFIGAQNYLHAFGDSAWQLSLWNSLLWFLTTVFIQAALGLFLAVALNRGILGASFFRATVLIPVALAPALTAVLFSNMFEPSYGQINQFLQFINLDFLAQNWLADPKLAIWCIITVNIWIWTGFSMVMYQAGLQLIPDELYEAAILAGASSWQQFRYLTFPLLRGTHAALLILGAIGTLKTFDIVFLMTRGGPYHASEMPSNYIFVKTFFESQFGYGAAMAVLLLLLALIITVLQLRLYRSAA